MAGYTTKEIDNWKSYEEIRLYGMWNMFSPQARKATGLTKEEYLFCMKNYSELKSQAEGK